MSLVRSLELSVIRHATESEERVLKAANNSLPLELRTRLVWTKTTTEGYYGNPIHVYRLHVEGEDAERVFSYIIRSMDKGSLRYVLTTLDTRLDRRRHLYIRLHKQLLCEGRLVVWDGDDVVRVVVKLNVSREELEKLIKSLLEE